MKINKISEFLVSNLLLMLLLFLLVLVLIVYAQPEKGSGSEVIHPASAFIVVNKEVEPKIVEVGDTFTITLNVTNTGQNPACSIDIIDYLDDNFILVPGSVEIYAVSSLDCRLDNQYANPNRVKFRCERLYEWKKLGNSVFIKFNLTVGSNVNTTKNLSLRNHVNILNVTAYYASYDNNNRFICNNCPDCPPIGYGGEMPNNETNEPGDIARRGNMTDREYFTVIPQSKIFVMKDISPGFSGIVEIGDYINFTISITNLGAYNVTNIKVNDTLPRGFILISMSPDPYTIIIPPGETKNVSVRAFVTSNISEGININFVNVSGIANRKKVSATAMVPVFVKGRLAVPHLIIEKYSLNPTVKKVGDTWQPAQYKITIRNVGTGRAHNVGVVDILPTNWTITALTSQSCDDDNIVTWNGKNFSINAISSGASCYFSYTVAVPPGDKDGLYVNTARALGHDGMGVPVLPAVEDSAYTFLFTEAAIVSLQVTKTANNLNPEPGDKVNFTINLCNPLAGNITNITIIDYLPYGFDFVNATNTSDIRLVAVKEGKIVWNMSVLEPGMINCRIINLTIRINPNVTKGINVNTVFAEGRFGNQTAHGATNLPLNVRKPVIYVKKRLGPGQNALVMPGENVTYEVEIGNVGDATAYNVYIEDIVPFRGTDLEWKHIGAPFGIFPAWCNVSRINNIFYLNYSLSPLSICIFRFNVSVSIGTGDGQYYNTIKGWAKDKANGTIGPSIDTASVFIRGFAALEVIKKLSTDKMEFQPGEIVGFNISISNRGHGQVSKIDITDTLPPGVVYHKIICPLNVTCIPRVKGNEIHVGFYYTLNPDDTIIIQLFANVTSNASAGSLPNKVTVIATRPDGGKLIDKDIAMIIVKKPYLLIEKWSPSPTRPAGTSVTYLVRIRNIGTGTAKNITVFDSMDTGFTHISSNESPKILSGVCKNISIINRGQNATFVIDGELNEMQDCVFQYIVDIGIGVADGSYPNFATLSAKDNAGTDLPNQTVIAYVFVVRGIAVEVRKMSNVSIAQPGDIVNFTIEISNRGDAVATVSIVDTLPYGFSNLSQTSWENVRIDAHATKTKNVIARVETIAPEFNLNEVTVFGMGVMGAFSISDFAIVIVKKPRVILSKRALIENSYAGGRVIYEISVLNEGGADAGVVYITDKLPGNFTYIVGSVTKCDNYTVGVSPNSSVNEITFNITNFPPGRCKFYFSAFVPEGTHDGLYGNTIYGNYSDKANGTYIILPKTEAYVNIISVTAVSRIFVYKSANKNVLEPGDNVTFMINVTNPGLSAVGNVYVEDYLPTGFNITSCEINNDNLTKEKCNESKVIYRGLMPAGTTITIFINATVLSNATEFTTFNKVTAYAIANDTISLKDDDVLLLTINKPYLNIKKLVGGNATVDFNFSVPYIIKIKNTGNGKAYNIKVKDSLVEFCVRSGWCRVLPSPVRISGDCSVTVIGNANTTPAYFSISDMGGNTECIFTYNLTVPAIPHGLYENNATVYWTDRLGFIRNDTDKAYIQVPCCAGILSVRKEMDKIIAQPGDIIKAKIYIDAIGSSFDIVVRDILPYGWNYINATRDGKKIVCSQNGSIVNCTPFHMERGAQTIIELNLILNSSVITGNNINVVSVLSRDYLNNSYIRNSSAVVYVDKPSIFIAKSVDIDEVEPGASPRFTLIISNPSMAKIYNISVKDVFPIGITYAANSTYLNGVNYPDSYFNLSRKGNYNITGENITWSLGDLAPKGLMVLTFTAHVKCNVTKGDFFNYVYISGRGRDRSIISANSSVRMTGYIANATIFKYASTYYVSTGSIVDYTIVIQNRREGAGIVPLILEDRLPVGLGYIRGYSKVGNVKMEPVLRGSHRRGYILIWNLSDFYLAPGTTLTIEYRTRVRENLANPAINYAFLTYLDPPVHMRPEACPDCIFKNNASTMIGCYNCTVSGETVNFTLRLRQGWNLISIPIIPLNTSAEKVFASVEKYRNFYIFGFVNNSWIFKVYYEGKWYGKLDEIDIGTGYWIYMPENAELNIEGYKVNDVIIPLHKGWNLIGWPSLNSVSFNNISLNYTDIYSFDISWIHRNLYGFGDLDKFEPGKGYWIKVNRDTSIYV